MMLKYHPKAFAKSAEAHKVAPKAAPAPKPKAAPAKPAPAPKPKAAPVKKES